MNIEKKYILPLSTILGYLFPSGICRRWHPIGFILQSCIPLKLPKLKKKLCPWYNVYVVWNKWCVFADALSMNVQVLLYFKQKIVHKKALC